MFITMRVYSEALGEQTIVNVILPQGPTLGEIGVESAQRPSELKCLYLLHGLSDDETIWSRRTSIERYAVKYGICVVMPRGGKSFYSDEKYGNKYYTFIAKELPKLIEDTFPVSSKREDRYVGGNSMGGYGALKIALTEEGRYAAAFGLSLVADIHSHHFTPHLHNIFGGPIPDHADLFKLADAHEHDAVKPRLYVTTGTGDFMYDDIVRLDKHMQTKDYDYTYVETDGLHCWELWDETVQTSIEWMLAEK